MTSRPLSPGALALLVLALGTGEARAQEAHVFFARGHSSDADFGSTSGHGVSVVFRTGDRVRVQMTLDTRSSTFQRVGTACINPVVDFRCNPEPIRTENSFSSFTVAVLHSWAPAAALRLGAGAGIVIGSTDSDNMSESGRQAKIFVKETAQTGLMGVMDAQVRPFPDFPFVLIGQWQARRIRLVACVRDEETYDPFCGTDWWSEVQLGVGVRF